MYCLIIHLQRAYYRPSCYEFLLRYKTSCCRRLHPIGCIISHIIDYLIVLEYKQVNTLFLDILTASPCSPYKDWIIKVIKCLTDLLSTILIHASSSLLCFQKWSLPEFLQYDFCSLSILMPNPKHGFSFMLSLNTCAPLGILLQLLYQISLFSICILSFPLYFSEA